MSYIFANGNTVKVTAPGIAAFKKVWPCSGLPDNLQWFEFAANGDLVDTSITEESDGSAAAALADDCKAFLQDGTLPEWCE